MNIHNNKHYVPIKKIKDEFECDATIATKDGANDTYDEIDVVEHKIEEDNFIPVFQNILEHELIEVMHY